MGWRYWEEREIFIDKFRPGFDPYKQKVVNFDPNDATLVVKEMVKRGEYTEFERGAALSGWIKDNTFDPSITAWLLTTNNGEATNFFRAMAAFVKERKGK